MGKKLTDKQRIVYCSDCAGHVLAKEEGSYHFRSDEEQSSTVVLLSCPDCREPFLMNYTTWRADDDGIGEDVERVFPEDGATLDLSVPPSLRHNYWEAKTCFQNGAYKATAVMCRSVLDTAATNFGATARNLDAKLKDLKSRGIIDGRMFEWANDVLRELGNEAAHDAETEITKADAQDALEFTKVILNNMYVAEAAFKKFKKRRTDAKAKADLRARAVKARQAAEKAT
jgi:hypothetical protein